MANSDEQALPFVFRVLEGDLSKRPLQTGQPAGTLVLSGRGMPQGVFTIEGDQRSKTTWYGGNPKGRQQAIGPTELPTTLSGIWKDKYLGAGQAVALSRLFIDIRRRAPLIEMSWGAGYLGPGVDGTGGTTVAGDVVVGDPFTLQGLLKKTKFSFRNPSWCEWELSFEWNGMDELTTAPVMATSIVNAREGLANVTGQLDSLHSAVSAFRNFVNTRLVGMPARMNEAFTDALSGVDAAADAVRGAAAAAAKVPTFQATQPLIGTLRNAMDAAVATRTLIELFDPSRMVASDAAYAIYELRSNMLVLLGLADSARSACAQAVESLGRNTSPDVIAEVSASGGSDLRELAQRYYGDPDGWVDIAEYNGLPTSEVPYQPTGPSDQVSTKIKIPRRGLASGLAGGC